MGFVEDAESTAGQKFMVVFILPNRTVSLHLVADVDKLLRREGTPLGAVPVAVFQAERVSFAAAAGIDPVFPQVVDFDWAAENLSKAPVVPSMISTVLKYLGRLDPSAVAPLLVEWGAGAPAPAPRLSYREAAALKPFDADDWRDYIDD